MRFACKRTASSVHVRIVVVGVRSLEHTSGHVQVSCADVLQHEAIGPRARLAPPSDPRANRAGAHGRGVASGGAGTAEWPKKMTSRSFRSPRRPLVSEVCRWDVQVCVPSSRHLRENKVMKARR